MQGGLPVTAGCIRSSWCDIFQHESNLLSLGRWCLVAVMSVAQLSVRFVWNAFPLFGTGYFQLLCACSCSKRMCRKSFGPRSHILGVKLLICCTANAPDTFLGVSGKSRGCRNHFFPLERVAYSCDSSASPTGKSDLSNPDENLIIKNVYFASAGLVVSGLKAPQSPAVVRCNQPCGSLGRSALFPGKLMNLMDLGELCASPGVCGHTAHPVHCSASGERRNSSLTPWVTLLCHGACGFITLAIILPFSWAVTGTINL